MSDRFWLSEHPVSSVRPVEQLPTIPRSIMLGHEVVGQVTEVAGEQFLKDAIFVQDFPKLCTRTEASNSDQQVRVQRALELLERYGNKAVEVGNELDLLKRYIFYGKVTPVQMEEAGFKLNEPYPKDVGIRAIRNIRLIHGAIGAVTEPAEMMDGIIRHIFHGESLDIINIIEEMGDTLWYFGVICDILDVSLVTVMRKVIGKLLVRYPDKFDEVAAMVRDLVAERKSLESAGS